MTFGAPFSLRLFSAATLAAFGLVALLPVAAVLVQSVRTNDAPSPAAYSRILSEPRQWSLLRNTLVLAAGTSVLAAVLGVSVAFALERRLVFGRRALMYLLAMPLLIPPYIGAIVWAEILGRQGLLRFGLSPPVGGGPAPFSVYSTAGAILVLAFSYFPIVAFASILALRRYDPRIEEPARLVASRGRILRSIAAPLLAPAILGACALVFVLTLLEFAVPSFLQVNVYTVEIYERFSLSYDPAEAAALAIPLVVCGAAALGGWALYARARQGRLAGAGRPARPSGGSVDWLATLYALAVAAIATVLPVAFLVRRSWPPSSYTEAWVTAREEIVTSLVTGAGSATLMVGLGLAMALLARDRRPTAPLYSLSLAPFLASGPIVGVGLILAWNRPGAPALVYDTVLILVLAGAARLLFFVHQGLNAALRDVPRRYDEAAAVCGVPWHRQALGVLLPPVAPAVAAAWGLSFILSLRELDAAVLVAPPGRSTLAVRLFGLMHYGPSRLVAALSVITVVMVAAGAAATALAYRRLRRLQHDRR